MNSRAAKRAGRLEDQPPCHCGVIEKEELSAARATLTIGTAWAAHSILTARRAGRAHLLKHFELLGGQDFFELLLGLLFELGDGGGLLVCQIEFLGDVARQEVKAGGGTGAVFAAAVARTSAVAARATGATGTATIGRGRSARFGVRGDAHEGRGTGQHGQTQDEYRDALHNNLLISGLDQGVGTTGHSGKVCPYPLKRSSNEQVTDK